LSGELVAALIGALINLGLYSAQVGLYFWEGGRRSRQGEEPLFAPYQYYAGNVGDVIGLTVLSVGVANTFFEDLRFTSWITPGASIGFGGLLGIFRLLQVSWSK